MIYSASRECPCCLDSSDIVFLKNKVTNQIFFVCYACGTAWNKLHDWNESPDLLMPKDIAPMGFEVATLSDIKLANLEDLINYEYSKEISEEMSSDKLLSYFI